MAPKQRRRYRKFSPAFKKRLVSRVLADKATSYELAKKHDISRGVIARWVEQARKTGSSASKKAIRKMKTSPTLKGARTYHAGFAGLYDELKRANARKTVPWSEIYRLTARLLDHAVWAALDESSTLAHLWFQNEIQARLRSTMLSLVPPTPRRPERVRSERPERDETPERMPWIDPELAADSDT